MDAPHGAKIIDNGRAILKVMPVEYTLMSVMTWMEFVPADTLV